MGIREAGLQKVKRIPMAARLVEDRKYRVLVNAVFSLVFNLMFALYNGILGVVSASLIFVVSAVYYLLLWAMRFGAVISGRKQSPNREKIVISLIGVMLVILSIVLQTMIIVSMRFQTAAVYGTIPMITIATYTFIKITTAVVSAVRHRKDSSRLIQTIHVIRYAEVAVSLLTMQQSMLASFGEGTDRSAVILNACTGAACCFFILGLGIATLKNNRKE